ncbi:uncharacterized protein LOC118734936 [Rhagoletis pomonella]|uniref:uncharacterized protein LOC118734936 n=1 Tax=Rhagoletis pomonella TaxID=28610 RepID=UPI001781D3D8|nr:uncharacterized protein LOC118734936 [Rhagoletis pomonella]
MGKVEVHIFVDASHVAFFAVGYLRILHEGNIDVSFVMGTTRTAPTKLMSIPRLELQSAVLGTRLFKLIQESHEFTIERAVFWSDSQTVLQWIHSSQRKYKAFVGHRISEILTSTAPEQWRWVPTAQNTADAAMRPLCPPKFDINNRWVKGPDLLKYHEQYWPTLTLKPEGVLPEEIKTEAILLVQPRNSVIDFSRFGSFSKLRRTTAWVMRAANLFRKQPNSEVNPSTSLSVTEIEAAENMICKLVQRECYESEISNLPAARKLSRRSSLYKLSPYVDESGVLRLSGRIDETVYLPYQTRRPILLPPEHAVSVLVVKEVHERSHHQNLAVTINATRQSSGDEEDEPLTPNQFLLGCVNSTQTPHPVDEQICLRKQWGIAQNLKDGIWKHWTSEYLPQLLRRTKWQEKATPLKVNDVVIVCDATLPRRQ